MGESRATFLSASLVCADVLNLGQEIIHLVDAKVDTIHFDVMDGVFVPRLGLHPEILSAVRKLTNLPIDVHLMIDDPEPFIPVFAQAGATYILVHAEGNKHLSRTINMIKRNNCKAGVVLNPSTPLETIKWMIPELDMVMLMGINPGIVGHPFWEPTIDKIRQLKGLAGENGPPISIDGGVSFVTAPKLVSAGADYLVCGTSTIFRPPEPIGRKVSELRAELAKSSVDPL